MAKHITKKTFRKAQSQATPKSTVKKKVRRPAPEPKRTSGKAQVVQQNLDQELATYERAIELFNAGQFRAAKETFMQLTNARNRDLAHSADLRIRMCEQRLSPALPATVPDA